MNLNFSEPVDHILVRAGFCSDRSFKTFIRTHKVEICRQNNSENPGKENVVSRKIIVDNDFDSVFTGPLDIDSALKLMKSSNESYFSLKKLSNSSLRIFFHLLTSSALNALFLSKFV